MSAKSLKLSHCAEVERVRDASLQFGPGAKVMDDVLHVGFGLTITPWKLIGYFGVALFAGRWFVQMHYSRRHGRPVVPTVFWLMSISGSVLLLLYFIFGKNDSVGILSNLFPAGVAGYNLYLDLSNKRRRASGEGIESKR